MFDPDEFDRQFKRQENFFNVIFTIVVGGILLVFVAQGYLYFKGAQAINQASKDPNGVAHAIGAMIGQFQKGIEEGKK